jgi:hypothetical protein
MMRWLLVVLFGLSAASWTPLRAQQPRPAQPPTCDPSNPQGGSIRGRIVEDSTGRAVRSRGVFLVDTHCFSGTDSLGEFTFRGVRPGEYRVGVAPLGFRRHAPVPIVVQSGTTSDVGTIRLLPENLVADCMEVAGCAALLRAGPASVANLGDEEQLQEAVLRTSIALAGGGGGTERSPIPCAPDSDRAVFAALQQRIPELVPDSACALPTGEPLRSSAALRHTRSGRPAFSVKVSRIERDGAEATTRSSYYVGPLHAEGWVCRFAREGESWTPLWCKMAWIS